MCPSDRPIDTDTDTTNPAGMPRPRNTVASTRANRNETNTNTERENRQNPILIDGDENEEQRMMTLEEFLQYASEEPEWLYEKLQATHQRYDDSLDDHKVRLAEEELRGQTKDGEIALLRCETEEMKGQLQDIDLAWPTGRPLGRPKNPPMDGFGQKSSAHGRAGHTLSRPNGSWAGPFGPKWGKIQLARALHKLSLFSCNFHCISFTRRNHTESVRKVTVIFEFIYNILLNLNLIISKPS